MRKLISILIIMVLAFPCVGFCTDAADNAYTYEKETEFTELLGLFPDYDYESFYPSRPVLREDYVQIMTGIWKTRFEKYAERKGMVTAEEAVYTSVELLGYGERVKVSGKEVVATELKLTKNINMSTNRELTYGEFAALLYNMEDVALYEISELGGGKIKYEKSDETFLTGILKCREIEDILTDNGYTSITSLSNLSKSKIKIGNETFILGKENESVRDLIGRKVRGYVTNDDAVEFQKVVGLTEEPFEDFAQFDMSDFVGLSGNVLTYEENDKNKTLRLSGTPNVIYNGKFEKSLKKEFFDYEYGNVYVGSSDGSIYDTVIIEGYVSWCLSMIDSEEMKLYPSESDTSLANGKRFLSIDPQENEWVRMYDKYGDLADISDFYKNTVIDICENDGFVKLCAVDATKFEQKITSRDDDYYYTDNAKYLISKKYESNIKSVIPELGEIYDIYVNGFGYVIKAEKVSSAAEHIGIFVKAENINDKLETIGKIKLFNQNGEVAVYETTEKIKYTDGYGKTETLTYAKLYAKLKNLGEEMISYKLNSEGKISGFLLPAEMNTERQQGRLGYIMKNESYYYEANKSNLEGRAVVSDSATSIFTVNISVTDEDKRYSINKISNLGTGYQHWTLLNTEPGSPYAEYGIINVDSAIADIGDYKWFAISKLYKGVDSNGTAVNYMEGHRIDGGGAYSEKYFCEDDVINNVTDVAKSGSKYEVAAGDVVVFKNTLDEMDEIFMLYKHDTEMNGIKGMIAGNLGYYDSSNVSVSNPFILGKNSDALANGAYTLPWRTVYGYVYHVDARGNMTITTQDLMNNEYDSTNSDSRYITEYIAPHQSRTEIKYNTNSVSIKTATTSDIKAYDTVGKDCSRVIISTWYGGYARQLIINGGK